VSGPHLLRYAKVAAYSSLLILFYKRNGFLTGFPFMAAIINIPQRLQTVNSTTAIGAGIRLLPLLLLSPVASASSGFLMSKLKIPPLYLLITGGSLQVLGVGLFSSLDSANLEIPSAQYGYQAIMGFGFGLSLSTTLMMAPLVVQQKDMGRYTFCFNIIQMHAKANFFDSRYHGLRYADSRPRGNHWTCHLLGPFK
jgi:hypothetical protein